MAVTENFFTGDGSTTSYVLTFEYIDEADVKVSLDGVLTTAYAFANATTILFTSAPGNGVAIRIYRETSTDSLKGTFFAGSSIRAQDLNKNFEQSNFAVQEIQNYTWDNETDTIHSDETWVSNDTQIATTAAIDARFVDQVNNETIAGVKTFSSSPIVPTTPSGGTAATNKTYVDTEINDKINDALTTDIGTDGTGITVTNDGDGTITLGLAANTIDLDRIKNEDIITSAEANPNNDTTIATTAKIDDMIDAAITGDIAVDSTGLTVTNDGDGTITLGIGVGSVDFDRIKDEDIITLAEQDAGSPAPADTSIFTSSAAAKRFDTLVQTGTPSGSDYQIGKTWLQNDDDLTLKIWNGSAWLSVASGGAFTEQTNVVYVDGANGDDTSNGHRISAPKATIKAAINQINAEINTSITNGGSGYVNGSYTNVPLTGGSSAGLQANITVAGGVVTAVTVTSTATLENYSIGDVLSADNTNLGGTGSGLQITVGGTGDGQIVVVAAGVYQEAAPIQIKRRNVSIIGQALRSCLVHPTAETQGNDPLQVAGNHALFELNSGSYIANLTLTGMQALNDTGNSVDSELPTKQGWNFKFYTGATIIKSPYIQNCTNFSDSEIDNNNLNAHNPAGGAGGDTDSAPTGGGLLIDGSAVATTSPLRSMVCDSYTHVGLNGPGILVTNNGYVQATSSYAFFNKYHIKTLNGGQANLAASTTDFGDFALVAVGQSPAAIFTSNVDGAASDQALSFNINEPTEGAGWFGSATRPQSNMRVTVNGVTYPILSAVAHTDSEGGNGWTVTISRPDPANKSINLGLNGSVADDAAVSFFLRSQIASSGHTMEYVGSGTNYTALPENGGVPIEANQIFEDQGGKVWTAITDHNGKFKIGGNQTEEPIFEVNQQTGFVTIPTASFTTNLLSDLTPQLGGNLDVNGYEITSASNGNIVINPNGTGVIRIDKALDGNTTGTIGTSYLAVHADDLHVRGDIPANTALPTTSTLTVGREDNGSGVDHMSFSYVSGESPTTPGTATFGSFGSIWTSNGDFDITAGLGAQTNDGGGNPYYENITLQVRNSTGPVTAVTAQGFDTGTEVVFNDTTAIRVPVGTTAQRPAGGNGPAAATGQLRYNSTISQFEGYNGTAWGTIGAGATGGGSDAVFIENDQTVNTDYTIPANKNAMSTGPITVAATATVTISSGSNWVIL